MKLYLKQHIFTWGDRFSVYDYNGRVLYTVEGEVFTLGKKLHIYDANGSELGMVRQELFRFLPTYIISKGEWDVATVVKEFTFFVQEYSVPELSWRVSGDFFDHDYAVEGPNGNVALVYREWFTLGDAYAIDVGEGTDPVLALAVALVIDAVISAQRNN